MLDRLGSSKGILLTGVGLLFCFAAHAAGPVSDDFHATSLNTALWTFFNPVGDGTFAMTGSDLVLNVPSGANHDPTFGGSDNSVRMSQSVSNTDFTIEVKFDSIPSQQYQFQGILAEQDASNLLRFQFGSTGSSLIVNASQIVAGVETAMSSAVITPPGPSVWMRVQRTGSTWTQTWSPDGTNYTPVNSFTQSETVGAITLFAGNFNSTPSDAPSFAAYVDYFFNTASPISPEDGGGPNLSLVSVSPTAASSVLTWTTDVPASSRVDYGTATSYGSFISDATLTTAHSITIPNLACATTYDFQVTSALSTGSTDSPNGTFTTSSCASIPDLTISKSHTGSFTQGQTGASYTIVITNSGTASTSAAVSVSDSVPAGLTATAIAGAGWTCTQPSGPCTRSDSVAAGTSYPNLTVTVNVANSAPASVTNTATVSGGGEANTSNDTATDVTTISASSGALISDDFSSTTLNPAVWTFVNPQGDGSFSLNGSTLQLNVPAGINHDLWVNGENGVRVMQSIADVDFEVEVKFNSVVDPAQPAQEQGIVVEQDGSDFLRFSEYSSTQQTILFVASCLGTTGNIIVNQPIRSGPNTYMRVKRVGSQWFFTYSYDSIHWTPAFTFSQALTVTKIGPYAANAQSGGSAPAFTAIVDHFVNRLSPPSTMDGNPYPASAPPVINVWYGNPQTFGQNGVPQQWVNIVGDVSDYDEVSSLVYSLNGGASQTLWMGENQVRLVSPGDYNVEIDYASLTAGTNTVAITAADTAGRQTTRTITVNYVAGQSWPKNYSINWSGSASVQGVSQVVDGMWQIQPTGFLENVETGYDRLVTIGDRVSWLNYVVTAEVTLNQLDGYGYAVGIIAGWQGHTTLQYGVALPDQPRTGHPFPGFGGYSMGYPGPPIISLYENTPSVPENTMAEDTSGLTLSTGVKYIFKLQTQQNTSGGTHYSFKVWPASTPEPAAWNVQADGELSNGSIVLVAHHADVSFGAINITGN